MSQLNLTTAGESHGPCEVCILEGVPAGLALTTASVDAELARRQKGYGRGGRMAIETDQCEFASGVRLGETIGSPIAMIVANKDHENWLATMGAAPPSLEGPRAAQSSAVPRPGHADFAGMVKYGFSDIRPVLERASARETVARVAGGAVCKRLLEELGICVRSRVVSIGQVVSSAAAADFRKPESVDWQAAEDSPVGCDSARSSAEMCEAIDVARAAGESLGGVFEVWAWGICPGLGDHTSLGSRLDGRLLGALGSIPAIKGAEVGSAFEGSSLPGSQVHDEFSVMVVEGKQYVSRSSNRAGGIEGGMTNGMPVILRAAMKPIPTLISPLSSVDLVEMRPAAAHVERSDVTAVPAAGVVAEAMVALVLAAAHLEKFGGDSMQELTARVSSNAAHLEEKGLWRRS